MKVVIATPTIKRPHDAYLAALEASVPALDAAGIEHYTVFELASTYISWARANMLQKAMEAGCDAVVFIDHDMSWRPEDLVKLIQTPGDVVCGTYRFKLDNDSYMASVFCDDDGRPELREDGCIRAENVPAGFLKVTTAAVRRFAEAYPELVFGPKDVKHVDLFNHGAWKGVWWGEDYAFSRRWRECGGDIWIVPDLSINHHGPDKVYAGNFHQFLLKQPQPK